MRRAPQILILAASVAVLTVCAPCRAEAQAGSGTLHASVSKVLSARSVVAPGMLGNAVPEHVQPTVLGEAAAFTAALAELFEVPVSLSRLSFSVDNALSNMDQYRAFEYVAPQLYYASRVYRVSCSLLTF